MSQTTMQIINTTKMDLGTKECNSAKISTEETPTSTQKTTAKAKDEQETSEENS